MFLTLANKAIPIPAGTAFQLVLRSPLFDNDQGKTPGSYFFNLELGASPILQSIYAYPHRAALHGRAVVKTIYHLQAGSMHFTGTALLEQANPEKYQVRLMVRNGDFAAIASEIKLTDLNLGGDRVFSVNPYAIGTSNIPLGIYSTDEFSVIELETPIQLTHTIVDFSAGFTLLYPLTYTATANGTFYFEATGSFAVTIGQVWMNVYKNNLPMQQFICDQGVFTFNDTWLLLSGDVITFTLFAQSGTNANNWNEISFQIDPDFFFTIRTPDSLFVDIANGNQDTADFAVFPIENPRLFDNFPEDEFQLDNVNIKTSYSQDFPVQNYWKDGHFPYMLSGNKNNVHTFAMNVFTPFVYISYILNSIAEYFGYELKDSPFTAGNNYYNAILYNSFAENNYTFDDARMIAFKSTFTLSDHVPAIPVTDFLRNLGKMINYRIDIDTENGTITFMRLKSVIESTDSVTFPGVVTRDPDVLLSEQNEGYKIELKPTTDNYLKERIKDKNDKHVEKGSVAKLNLLPSSGNTVNDSYLVESLNEIYVFRYDTKNYRLNWMFHSLHFFLTRTSGDTKLLTISGDMAPVADHETIDSVVGAPADRSWRIPVTWQPGNFEGFPDLTAETGLQILIYQGMANDSNNELYPLATSGRIDYEGNTLDNPNLCLIGPEPNLFTEEFRSWVEWLTTSAKPVKLYAAFTPGQLKRLKWTKNRILGTNYLIEEIRVNLVDDHLTEAEIRAYSC